MTMPNGNPLNKIKRLSSNQHNYASALNHGQLLAIVSSLTAGMETAAEFPATDEEIEVAVYGGACT